MNSQGSLFGGYLLAWLDEFAYITAQLEFPSFSTGNAALLCRAEASGKTAEIKRLLNKPVGTAPSDAVRT